MENKEQDSIIYEVVSGQISLSHREEFFKLHSEILLPMMKQIGIKPVMLLITEVGRYGRFLDIYQYNSFQDYQTKTEKLLAHLDRINYYEKVDKCIQGSITIEIMRDLPYAKNYL